MNKTLLTLSALAIFAFGTLGFGLALIGSYNGAATLRNTYEMKIKANESEFDNMFKKIQQASQIPNEKKNAFKEIYQGYASSRSSGSSNQMMTWIKEAVPNADLKIYDQLMNIITGSRDSWTMKQSELVSIAEQYNQRLSVIPGNFILPLMGFQKIDPKVITSTRTTEVFSSDKDDDLELFKK
jgi:hypothetical protein